MKANLLVMIAFISDWKNGPFVCQSGGFTNLLCKSVKCLERIKSALQRKRSGILLSPATNLLSVRFHIVDKYLHSLII